MYDMIIIGSGPAGLSASVYAKRAMLSCLTLEKNFMSGGQVLNTDSVDNYLGLPGINGFDMCTKFREHADELGAAFAEDTVTKITAMEQAGVPYYQVIGENGTYETRTIVMAAGATHRMLGVPGEEEYAGRGVSYCATCDGAFFKNRNVCVVGGGDVAVEDAIYLARMCRKVYLIHRRDTLRAAKQLQETLFSLPNVELIWNSTVSEILGDDMVHSVVVTHENRVSVALPVSGVFVAVGIIPAGDLLEGLAERSEGGYIIADETGKTSAPGIFAAGDVRTKALRQIVTAVSDGANAVASAEHYLASLPGLEKK